LTHRVTDEPETEGSPYNGFFRTRYCAYIQFRDCHLTGHKIYQTIGAADLPVSMGTYDVYLNSSVGVTFTNCKQDNIMDDTRWGVIASNYCKDVCLDGCVFSRMDAHMNIANLTVKNTTLGWQGFNAIGHGKLTVENVTIMGPSVVNLRGDYGSTWDGELFIKNVTWYPLKRVSGRPAVIVGANAGEHDFGFACSLPHRIFIENLYVYDAQHDNSHDCVALFGGINDSNTLLSGFGEPSDNDYPYLFTERLIAYGLATESGKGFKLWSGDLNKCYCAQSNAGDSGAAPNFRALITDADRFVYDVDGYVQSLSGVHSLVPDIRLSDCPKVVIKAGDRPAKFSFADCAFEEAVTGNCSVEYDNVRRPV